MERNNCLQTLSQNIGLHNPFSGGHIDKITFYIPDLAFVDGPHLVPTALGVGPSPLRVYAWSNSMKYEKCDSQ